MKNASRDHATKELRRRRRRHALSIVAAVGVAIGAGVAVAAGTSAIIKMKQPADPEMGPVSFKHWKHQRSYKCYVCHPGVFSQWEQAVFDHDAMSAGKYCGTCHNGKVAFLPDDKECEVCHAE